LDLSHPWNLEPIQAIEMALACEAKGLSIDKRITNSDGVHVSTYHSCHGFATTQGFEGIQESTRHSISCSLLAADGAGMQRDYDYTTAHDATHLLPLDELARRTVERATSRLSARPIKTQQAPVLFSSRVSSGLFGSLIGAISGNNLYRKNSFLLDSLGQKIFPEFIRVYEQPHLLDGLGSAPFDGEGVLTRPNVLVDQGRLCQYVLSSYSARKLGLATTANCGGVFNLTIDPTAGDLTTLLQMMDTGLLVTELMGQGVNGLTGDYSRGASGFWVSGGKIQYPVEGITIAGNLKDIFQRVLAVGRDINPNIATRCGSVLIESMTIAGE
jgi:PmbA protein